MEFPLQFNIEANKEMQSHKNALTLVLVFAVCSPLFIIPMMIMVSVMPTTRLDGNPINVRFSSSFLIAMPIFYFVFTYLSTAFCAWVYNKVSKYTEGIKFETTEKEN